MAKGYSKDLRERAVVMVEEGEEPAGGRACTQACSLYGSALA
jgi:hypothetical protein